VLQLLLSKLSLNLLSDFGQDTPQSLLRCALACKGGQIGKAIDAFLVIKHAVLLLVQVSLEPFPLLLALPDLNQLLLLLAITCYSSGYSRTILL